MLPHYSAYKVAEVFSLQATPYAILTLSVFCADSEEQARALQLTYDLNLFRFFSGQSNGLSLTPQVFVSDLRR